MALTKLVQNICPPIVWAASTSLRGAFGDVLRNSAKKLSAPDKQRTEMYWDPKMAETLEVWGEGTVWDEIQSLLVNCRGRVLDIACGTGKTIAINSKFSNLELYGCDISDFLLSKAIERGISKERLLVCDATKMSYSDDFFDYAYSIGSLEHFTEQGITSLFHECRRTVKRASFHMIPVSRDGRNHGWIDVSQSYHVNSIDWWLEKCRSVFSTIYVLNSTWSDRALVGKWLICVRE